MSGKPSKQESQTNWAKVDELSDSDIDTSDVAPLDAEFFRHAELRMPVKKQSVTVRLDSDVLEWFRQQGKGYQTRINAVLRTYMEAHRKYFDTTGWKRIEAMGSDVHLRLYSGATAQKRTVAAWKCRVL